MGFVSVLALAVGLAMDATAVAAARGLAAERLRGRDVLAVALLFGGFQAAMPLAGALLGTGAERAIGASIAAWDHWVAFALLCAIGGKMLHEALRSDGAPKSAADLFHPRVLLVLAVATSLDAFAAGFTLPLLDAPLGLAVATIGVTTALLSAAGVLAGKRLGAAAGSRLDALGGAVLVGMGVKVLVTHLSGG